MTTVKRESKRDSVRLVDAGAAEPRDRATGPSENRDVRAFVAAYGERGADGTPSKPGKPFKCSWPELKRRRERA